MNLSTFKNKLKEIDQLTIELPDGNMVPAHFHITEVGQIEKNFIDCGGTVRKETKVSFQLWQETEEDDNHRLKAEKLLSIIQLSEEKLNLQDAEIEVEYQGKSIEKYGMDFNGKNFQLVNTQTDCLAKELCGIPTQKPRVKLSDLQKNSCTPGGGCC